MFPTLNITLGLKKRSRSRAYRLASANKSALELALKFAVWCRDFEGGELFRALHLNLEVTIA